MQGAEAHMFLRVMNICLVRGRGSPVGERCYCKTSWDFI